MDELQEALKELRDVHEPVAISYWPLAPGWWLLIFLVFVMLLVVRWWLKRGKPPNYKKMANNEFENIVAEYNIQHNSYKTTIAVAELIRKLLISTDGRDVVAGLINDEWLAYLDKRSRSHLFTQGGGHVLTTVIYQRPMDVDVDSLFVATKALLKNV